MLETDCHVTEYSQSEEYDRFSSKSDDRSRFRTIPSYSTNSDNELDKLISLVEKGIRDDEPGIKYIEHPVLLLSALKELKSLVGMESLKRSIALQTVELIERMKAGEKNMAMLNAMLSGPPGVGKTKASSVLAKIWHGLGFLSRNNKTIWRQSAFEGSKGESGGLLPLILLVGAWMGSYVLQILAFLQGQIGWLWISFLVGVIILAIIIAWYYRDTITEHYIHYTQEEVVNNDDNLITVVSRNDFVAEYMGHTSGKTKKLLEANTGKVLLIDEAYSLINGVNDNYGFECLHTLNLYLSENPNKIVVIFAGYRDQLKSTIFAAQPGLERRIMWRFNCDPYNGEELAKIFLLQARQDGWEISKTDAAEITRFIARRAHCFPAYGGDTERLVYLSGLQASQSQLNFSNKLFQTGGKPRVKRLTKHDVSAALKVLEQNQFS